MSGKRLKQDRGLPPAFLILLVLVLALTCASLLLAEKMTLYKTSAQHVGGRRNFLTRALGVERYYFISIPPNIQVALTKIVGAPALRFLIRLLIAPKIGTPET